MQYTFETLNDKDFECLVRDLLQKELGIPLESFKKGRDSGIDLRYAKERKTNLVVQAKHYYKSGYSLLKSKIMNEESKKVARLNPTRYIFVTSLGLTPHNKEEIYKIFTPFILDTGDIIGNDELNKYLIKYPDIERSYHKLWLSSVNIIQSIVNNAVHGRSKFHQESIQNNISKFVVTKIFNEAIGKISKSKILIITGDPGIGKTTLADSIVHNYLGLGYELVYINSEIKDAESLFNIEKKQIFYFDDFLGKNYLELIRDNLDSVIVNLIKRIENSKNKYLILTSRTAILKQAFNKYEVFNIENTKYYEYQIDVKNYTDLDKAKILYNHLYYSDLPLQYIDKIFEDKFYRKIIDHENYNPRLVQFISELKRIEIILPENYRTYIVSQFDRPIDIWKTAYERQLDDSGRFILETFFSLGDLVQEGILFECYNARLDYEKRTNNFKPPPNPFYGKLYELLGGFLVRENIGEGRHRYSFFNPSIGDFLLNYINQDINIANSIIQSAIYLEQISNRFSNKSSEKISIPNFQLEKYFELMKNKISYLKSKEHRHSVPIEMLYFLEQEFNYVINEESFLVYFQNLDLENSNSSVYKSVRFFENANKFPASRELLVKEFHTILKNLFTNASDQSEPEYIKEFIETVFGTYEEFFLVAENKSLIEDCLKTFWEESKDQIVADFDPVSQACMEEDMDKARSKFKEIVCELNNSFLMSEELSNDVLDDIDFDEILYNNQRNTGEDEDLGRDFREKNVSENVDNSEEIENLFDRES